MATVLIGADICPIGDNVPLLRAGDKQGLYNDLLEELQSADLRMANLECPLIRNPSPIRKTGPTFGADPECLRGVKAGGFDLLCLANNHILDHGEAGLRSTLDVCASAGVETVGAGENLGAARRMWIRTVAGVRASSCTAATGRSSPGAPSAGTTATG